MALHVGIPGGDELFFEASLYEIVDLFIGKSEISEGLRI